MKLLRFQVDSSIFDYSVNADIPKWIGIGVVEQLQYFLSDFHLVFGSCYLQYLKMSYFLPHLPSGWHVDEAIKSEEDRVVVIRFGHDWDSQCMTMDETLYGVADKVQNFAVIYLVDITEVPDFNKVREYPISKAM